MKFSELDEQFGDEVIPAGYWQERLVKAVNAYECLMNPENPDVNYRGFSLSKTDSSIIIN